MSATDELRKLLDERDEDYSIAPDGFTTWWHYTGEVTAWEDSDGVLTIWGLTPEQAIAATLGSGTCHMSFIDEYDTASGEEEYLCECSECGYRRWDPAHNLPLFCSKCGRR